MAEIQALPHVSSNGRSCMPHPAGRIRYEGVNGQIRPSPCAQYKKEKCLAQSSKRLIFIGGRNLAHPWPCDAFMMSLRLLRTGRTVLMGENRACEDHGHETLSSRLFCGHSPPCFGMHRIFILPHRAKRPGSRCPGFMRTIPGSLGLAGCLIWLFVLISPLRSSHWAGIAHR